MKTTFFKVDRDIQNNWLWNDKPFARGQAWIDLLLMATHTDHQGYLDGQVIDKKRGEVHVSIVFLAERWGWSRNKVYRFLRTLKNEKMVSYNGTTNGTIIYIEKYTFYQGDYTKNGTLNGTTDGTTTEQRTEHKQERKESKESVRMIYKATPEDLKQKWNEIQKKARIKK